ncbi:MAG: 50S ribosomal protein L23 [Thermoplasmata archaeon]
MKHDIVIHPYVSEKVMMEMEKENRIAFVVRRTATKKEIKEAVEKLFNVKVECVNTNITKQGKIGIIKLKKEYSASEIGARIGLF